MDIRSAYPRRVRLAGPAAMDRYDALVGPFRDLFDDSPETREGIAFIVHVLGYGPLPSRMRIPGCDCPGCFSDGLPLF